MDTVSIKKLHNNYFSSICSIQDKQGKEQKINSYKGLVLLFLKCFGKVEKVQDKTSGNYFHVNKSQYQKIMSAKKQSHTSPQISTASVKQKGSPQLQPVKLYTKNTEAELAKRGIHFTCNENSADALEVDANILYKLPKGHYYTIHLTTDRLHSFMDHDKLQDFMTQHPDGVILVFRKILNPKLFKQCGNYQFDESSPEIPTCTLFFPPTKETSAENQKTLDVFF